MTMMTTKQTLAPHEMLEVLEVLTLMNVCLTKSKTMQTLAQDEELKEQSVDLQAVEVTLKLLD